MAAYNDSNHLPKTINSILEQQNVDFEFVIINDGSTDCTPEILDGYANRDNRVRVFAQENKGLTRALIRGCQEARGEFIARQDVGDFSLPGRLAAQLAAFENDRHISFVSCHYELVGPVGEPLSDSQPSDFGKSIKQSLLLQDENELSGPPHGTVMFRKSDYEAVGGYRAQIYFAQDLDLWTRLIEIGDLDFVKDTYYRLVFEPSGITGRWRDQQMILREYIVELTRLRRAGMSEEKLLMDASCVLPDNSAKRTGGVSKGLYFIASCLAARGDPRANKYFRSSIRENPLNIRAWVKLLQQYYRRSTDGV